MSRIGPFHQKLIEQLRAAEGKRTPSDESLAVAIGADARQVAAMLADLSDARRIRINRQGGGRSIEVFPDRFDDSDEISRRIRDQASTAQKPPPAAKKMPPPQKASTASTSKKWPAPIGSPPSIEFRPIAELKVDDSYQRSIDTGPSRSLIERIAKGWDWRMCPPLVVSKRDDGFYVIDGQHRHAAALRRGDIAHLPCCVTAYRDAAEEAEMFVAMNRARRAINRLDDFHAAQASGNEEALAITAMVEAAGFFVSRRTGSAAWAPGEVAFTSAIAKARRRHGPAIVQEALNLMFDAFEGQRLVAGSSVFSATVAIITARPAGFTRERMLAALKHFDMAGWASFLDQSRGGTDRAKQLKDMLMAAYEDAGKAMAA